MKEGAFGTKTSALGFSMDKNKEISVKALSYNVVGDTAVTAKIFKIRKNGSFGTKASLVCVPLIVSPLTKETGLFLPGAYYPVFDLKRRDAAIFDNLVRRQKSKAGMRVLRQKAPLAKEQEIALADYFRANGMVFFRSSVPQTEPSPSVPSGLKIKNVSQPKLDS